jgi:hypothetical protein
MPTDSGIWICLLVQALVHNLPSTIITPKSIREARPYLAMSLIEQRIPKFSDLVIRLVGHESYGDDEAISESTITHIPGVYYPGPTELQGYLHSYNMLHDDYTYDPYIDDDISQTDRQLHSQDCNVLHIPDLWVQSKSAILDL